MNDASGERVDEHVRVVEGGSDKTPNNIDNERHPHLNPSRWWFASSAFPLIAGTLGPVASAFSICALVKPWRQFYPPGVDIDTATYIPDPIWLTILNGIQLAIAVISNMALLLNMTRRLRFAIAQPVTIIGWYISSVLLIGLVATADGPLVLQPEEEYIWSQAWYYAMYSSILYFVVASLMVVTFLGAQTGHYTKDFILTSSQRTLMLQTIMFLVYLLLGALAFSNIEGWNYLDAVYWSAVTLFTVGFGDFYATTTLGRALLMPFSLVGIISLGLVIGSIRSLVLERGKRRFDARIIEKKRRQMLRRMTSKGKDDILVPIQPSDDQSVTTSPTEFERRREEFKLMRKIQDMADRRRRWYSVTISGSTWLTLWLVGAKIFQECEEPYQGWSYFDGFYFSFVSLTTIGYGDMTPVSNGGKSFWVFWALLALPTTTVLISNAGDTIVRGIRDATDQIATVTILPGEQGFKKDLKRLLRTLSFGKLFEEEIEEAPPGFLGDAQRADYRSDEDEEEILDQGEDELAAQSGPVRAAKDREDVEEGVDQRRVPGNTKVETRPSPFPTSLPKFVHAPSMPRQTLPTIPSHRADYHLLLIEEIGRVMQHLKSTPPRKYTFLEWAWYLRLIGEDESQADKHRKAHSHQHPRGHRLRGRKGAREQKAKDKEEDVAELQHIDSWSWVGSRSPLMDSREEAEWILEKLTKRLTEELRSTGRKKSIARE
ncbi:hypothetical protein OQA88_9586 [Cercophora sp. LCS_1]